MVLKKVTAMIFFLILFCGVLPVSGQSNGEYTPIDINLWMDNQPVVTEEEFLTQNSSILVPAQIVFSQMGASVTLEPEEWKICIQSQERKLTMYIANYQCANGTKLEKMPAQPVVYQGTVMVPLRYVAEALGAVVLWNGDLRSVVISTTGELPDITEVSSRGKTYDTVAMDKTVVLDPGHGGSDPGAAVGSTKEKDLNLQVSKILKDKLTDAGVTVYMTREDDRYVGLYTRASIANHLKADLFVSIHHNASPDTGATGVMTLYYPTADGKTMNGQSFAQIVQKNLVDVLKTRNWGIIPRPNLVVVRETYMPAVIAELGFMTNKTELSRMVTYQFQEQAAQALFDSIMEALQQ